LSGEIRTISYIDRRITEAAKLGFKRIIIPKGNMKNLNTKKYKAEVTGVEKIREAVEKLV
jgi:DNA repair protein RadA/Sms